MLPVGIYYCWTGGLVPLEHCLTYFTISIFQNTISYECEALTLTVFFIVAIPSASNSERRLVIITVTPSIICISNVDRTII